jgi:hypothetical protein
MAIAKGVAKKVAYKKESTWGTAATGTGAKYIRRVTSDVNMTKETYESNEIRTDYQVADMRHGLRAVDGTFNGELSCGSYADWMQSVVARDFTSVSNLTGLSVTIAASGSLWTITRAAGDFLTDGIKVGSVVRLAGAGLSAGNVANNLQVVTLTSTVATVATVNGSSLVAEGPIASVTMSTAGKVTYAPLTGHTDDSYTVEEWYSDVAQSEVSTGVKFGTMNVTMPTTGLVTVDFTAKGKDQVFGTTQHFTTPTAAGTTGIFASVSGIIVVNGAPVGLITQADFSLDRGLESANVIGSNTAADIFTGRIRVTGNFTTYFTDGVFRGYFVDEDEISIIFTLAETEENNSDFVSFTLPKVKIGSATKSDGEMGITQSHSFTALLNDVTAGGLPETTLFIQDSTL